MKYYWFDESNHQLSQNNKYIQTFRFSSCARMKMKQNQKKPTFQTQSHKFRQFVERISLKRVNVRKSRCDLCTLQIRSLTLKMHLLYVCVSLLTPACSSSFKMVNGRFDGEHTTNKRNELFKPKIIQNNA